VSDRGRLVVCCVGLAGTAALLAAGVAGLPDFGNYAHRYGEIVSRGSMAERHVANAVAGVTYDYRSLDTLIEEVMFLAAVLGVALLLREHERHAESVDPVRSDGLRLVGLLGAGITFAIGLTTIAYGYLTPGGGFQGGVIVGTSFALVWAAGSFRAFRQVAPERLVQVGEGLGVAAFVLVGLSAVAAGAAPFENLLPLGTPNTLLSGGAVALLNWSAGLAVSAALVTLLGLFVEDVVEPV
jgi:multicomponent Na+:H+ antiporter subunit B